MCGIVGLLLKKPELYSRLGELMVPMLIGMHDRGPDSAGMAVFGQPLPEGQRKISLYSGLTEAGAAYDWIGLADALNAELKVNAQVQTRGNHAIFTILADEYARVRGFDVQECLRIIEEVCKEDIYLNQ